MHIWVSPGLDVVIALNPSPWAGLRDDKIRLELEQETPSRVLDAMVS